MANYNVDIAVALKGAQKLTAFNKDVRTTRLQVEGLNKTLKNLTKDQDLVVKSVSNVEKKITDFLFEDCYFSEAKQAFSRYRIIYPNGKFRPEALYWGAWATREMGEPIRAAFLWELLISDFIQSPQRPDAFLQAAESYIAEGDYKSSLDLLEILSVEYSNEAIGKEALVRMRKISILLKDSE